MRQLSKREKALLYALAVIAIVAGMFMLVIVPARQRGDELDEEIFNAQTEADSMRLLIAQVEGMRRDIAGYQADIELEKTHFLPAMNSDDLDQYITGMLQEHGLIAQSLAISADGGQTEADMVQTYRVDVVARGRISQFVALAETVKATGGVRIAAISLKQTTADAPAVTPTPTPERRSRRATPAPEPVETPVPTPYDPAYSMDVTFWVVEYNEAGEDAGESTPTPSAEPTPGP